MKWTFPNLRLFLALAVVTGGIYPLAVTLVSLILFPHQAHGSLIRNERGEVIASELIAQPFTSARYFWPRPSAGDYATMPSGASNLSWTSGELVRTVAERKAALLKAHNLPQETPVPADLLFASGSGLESCISPEAAEGGLIGLLRNGDIIEYSIPDRTLNAHLSEDEIARRRAEWQPTYNKVSSSWLSRYRHLATNASNGAVLRRGE